MHLFPYKEKILFDFLSLTQENPTYKVFTSSLHNDACLHSYPKLTLQEFLQ